MSLTPAFVLNTTYASIIVQFVTSVISLLGLFVPLAPQHLILRHLLILETVVQFIEFLTYIVIVNRYQLQTMAATRYFDWVVTTPIMLFTISVFMVYSQLQEKNDVVGSTSLRLMSFLKENSVVLSRIFAFNFGMLIFGYLGEIGLMSRPIAWSISSIFFILSFGTLYMEFAYKSDNGRKLFAFVFSVWALYAVAYLLSTKRKNVMINGLDIISKNFFGFFLAYFIFKKNP